MWAHFPAFFTGRCGHMTKFWLMGQAKMLHATSGLGPGKRATGPSPVFSLHCWNTNVTGGPGAAIINHKVSELKPHTADHCPPLSHCSDVIPSWGPSEHPFLSPSHPSQASSCLPLNQSSDVCSHSRMYASKRQGCLPSASATGPGIARH